MPSSRSLINRGEERAEAVRRWPTSLVIALLRIYKWLLSPLLPPACRYTPTCSEYAMEAVDRYGVVRGGLKAAWRVLRCHPFVQGGYDPVNKKEIAELLPNDCDHDTSPLSAQV